MSERDERGRFMPDPHKKHHCDEQCVIEERQAHELARQKSERSENVKGDRE